MYIEVTGSTAFGYYAQVAETSLIPVFEKIRGVPMNSIDRFLSATMLMPSNDGFTEFIEMYQGNYDDPRSLFTDEWKNRWNDHFDYFFCKGLLNTTGVEEGTTVYVDSLKISPAGDWPLSFAFRKEVGLADAYLAEANATYNGTFYSAPFSAGNVSSPDTPINPNLVTMVLNYWPHQPLNMSATIAAYDLSAQWNERNFTLFLSPLTTALANLTTIGELTTFLYAHIVNGTRVALSSSAQTLETLANGTLTATGGWVVGPTGINATVTVRDQVTTGGILQIVDKALV
ncbi:BQ2448_966 [Microbotryum intermedium]|uniref:BQ2448_966 protein n=1 Tax=Microbotryum intermedium TaxID=269621 RepID=A0A238F6N3_9BASI|nr:BQ2448_966 [Microbotryum intermedium]